MACRSGIDRLHKVKVCLKIVCLKVWRNMLINTKMSIDGIKTNYRKHSNVS